MQKSKTRETAQPADCWHLLLKEDRRALSRKIARLRRWLNILEHGLSLLCVQNPVLYNTCVAGTKLPADPTAVSAAGSASSSIAGAGVGAGTP